MKRILILLMPFLSFVAFGQNAHIDAFSLKKTGKFEAGSDKMNYPMVRTSNPKVDSLINFDLKNKLTSNEFPTEPIDSTLIKWFGNQLIYMDFTVTYNRQGILSLNISSELCGAYCTSRTDYFNYSTINGKPLDLSAIIDTTGEFRKRVYKDKESQYKQQKLELKKMLDNPKAELDQTTYDWALEYYQDCEASFSLESFAIYPDYLEIIESCYLPSAIKSLAPIISLKYQNPEIEKYLKINIQP